MGGTTVQNCSANAVEKNKTPAIAELPFLSTIWQQCMKSGVKNPENQDENNYEWI